SRVTIFEASPRILANEDGELSDTAARLFGAQGIAVSAGVKIEEVRASHGAKVVSAREASGTEASTEFDEILVAVGRSPNVEDLDLGKAGVEYGKKGIRVDSAMRTSVPGIWAAGDVTETLQFTYVAWEQGEAAGWNATSKDARKVDYSILPRVTYCDPEVASVGMTEARSRDKGLQVKVGRWEYSSLPRAMVSGETEGLIKVIAEAGSGRILGGHIIGAQASILIHEIAAAMRGGITAEQIGKTVHAYPTFSEGVRWACKEAA
ncbi:MAG: FAD-dependent oxidoreductase, partial [Chloroflexi bacterium]|nr:FAD-dependent oxidoreductase [Chloroflexota bacterium]